MALSPFAKHLSDYVDNIRKELSLGGATELSYRAYLKSLMEATIEGLHLSEEKGNPGGFGRPDFTCFHKNVKVGYVETKDLEIDLEREAKSQQIQRYLVGATPNIILTNYRQFFLLRIQDTKPTIVFRSISLDLEKPRGSTSHQDSEAISSLSALFQGFVGFSLPTIVTATELASELSKRTKLLRDASRKQLEEDLELQKSGNTPQDSIYDFFLGFKELIRDAKISDCVDAFAQTITYGLFLAWISSVTPITRENASTFIPQNVQVIKKIFINIAGDEMPSSVTWVVDEIVDILNAADRKKLLSGLDFTHVNRRDPFTHFYEDFLAQYDPTKRKALGIYYTPDPVVSFIVRSVNLIVKHYFGKSLGLADEGITVLDPAAGTGTFLVASAQSALEEVNKQGLEGIETETIRDHILKDYYGFEILVSPYVISHLKLSLFLASRNYNLAPHDRAQVYLTNTLDPSEAHELGAFMGVLTQEVKRANEIKLNEPIIAVIGNPPYYKQSSNKSSWILELISSYKKGLKERRLGNLDDDYVKFIRFAQWKLDQTGSGVLGFISNNSFLENTTFRAMRQALIESFNVLYVLNLHGNSNILEKTPEGRDDENVFNIRQGVCISLFVKDPRTNEKKILYSDKWGSRQEKYDFLDSNDSFSVKWKTLKAEPPLYYFVPKELGLKSEYEKFLSLNEIFPKHNSGLETKKDTFLVNFTKDQLLQKLHVFISDNPEDKVKEVLEVDDIKIKDKDGRSRFEFQVSKAREILRKEGIKRQLLVKYLHRPFDPRWIYFSKVLISRTRQPEADLMLSRPNVSLCVSRLTVMPEFSSVLVADSLVDLKYCEYSRGCYFFPLFADKNSSDNSLLDGPRAWKGCNLSPTCEAHVRTLYPSLPSPQDVFSYVYAILHSRHYRAKYSAFLRNDFPRIPFVASYETFVELAKVGQSLIELHLGKTPPTSRIGMPTLVPGTPLSNKIEFVKRDEKGIFVNSSRAFQQVSDEVWEFNIGGYQVLDKWLKSRKGRELSLAEMQEFPRVAGVISDTLRIMAEIDQLASGKL